jgi:hypothetical protein
MHTGIFQETLRCALSKGEVASRATELAIVQKQIEDNELEAKATADSYKQKRKVLELERRSLAREVREESTFRPVECVQRFENGLIETVRTDTGETIATRIATESEKQTELFAGREDPDADDPEGELDGGEPEEKPDGV